MSMIKELAQRLADEQLNEAQHQNFRPGNMPEELMALAEQIDGVHATIRGIIEKNADQYDDALNHGVPNYESQLASALYTVERLLKELAGEMEQTNSTQFDQDD